MNPAVESLMRKHLPGLTEEQYGKLDLYAAMLEETNKQFNLTSLVSPEEIVLLHFYDALSLLRTGLFAPGTTVVDIGTGAGVPAYPLAVCSECAVTALDATAKKLAFLSDVSQKAGLSNLKTLAGRAEELGKGAPWRESFDVAVSRGVARMNVLAEWCLPFVKPGGRFVAMKGTGGREELEEAKNALKTLGGELLSVEDVPIPETGRTHTLIVVAKTRPTDPKYPRPNGRIKKKPL